VLGINDPQSGFLQTFKAKGSKGQVIGGSIELYAISNLTNNGLAVGNSQVNTNAYIINVSSGKTTLLPAVDNLLVAPTRINASVVVVGDALSANGNVSHGYQYTGGKASLFDPPGSTYTLPTAINAGGEIAGSFQDARGDTHGFTYTAGVFATFKVPGAVTLSVNAIDDRGRLAGAYTDATKNTHGFLVSGGVVRKLDYPGDFGTNPASFGPGGEVLGTIVENGGSFTVHGFIYDHGKFTQIDDPSASQQYGTALVASNALGVLAGEYFDANHQGHGFTAVCSTKNARCAK
jgi:hypothetical protein